MSKKKYQTHKHQFVKTLDNKKFIYFQLEEFAPYLKPTKNSRIKYKQFYWLYFGNNQFRNSSKTTFVLSKSGKSSNSLYP